MVSGKSCEMFWPETCSILKQWTGVCVIGQVSRYFAWRCERERQDFWRLNFVAVNSASAHELGVGAYRAKARFCFSWSPEGKEPV